MSRTVWEAFDFDHRQIVEQADRIHGALGKWFGKRAVEQVLQETLDFAQTQLRSHLEEEEAVLLNVVKEHLGDIHADKIDQDAMRRAELSRDLAHIQKAVALGKDVRYSLRSLETALRQYVEYEEQVFMPWVEEILEGPLMREVEARFADLQQRQTADVAIDTSILG